MSNDVIKGPGEYRIRSGEVWTCLAIVDRWAIGYHYPKGSSDTAPCLGLRIAETGKWDPSHPKHSYDVMPPEPVITGPGPYQCRDGGSWHCSVVIQGIAYGHRQLPYDSSRLISGTRDAHTGECNRAIDDEQGDVIRKRVTP